MHFYNERKESAFENTASFQESSFTATANKIIHSRNLSC